MNALHRRAAALLGLIALLAFISGAGLHAPSTLPAALLLLCAVFVQPGPVLAARLEPFWRAAALLLAGRAALHVVTRSGDPVLPMVDLLLLLLCAESLRLRDGSGDARHFALTFALLVASAAYRPGPLFGILFLAYVACGTIVLLVGHVTREARARGLSPPSTTPAALLRTVASSAVIVAASALVFLLFPRAGAGWTPRATPLASALVGFSDRVSIGEHGARIEPNSEVVMRIEFPQGRPPDLTRLRWRGRAYDRFDGSSWSRSAVPPDPRTGLHDAAGPFIDQLVHGRKLSEANVLFGLHPIVDIEAHSPVRVRRVAHGDFVFGGDVDPVYLVRSHATRPEPAALRKAHLDVGRVDPLGGADAAAETLRNLQLPPLSARLLALADSFRAAAATPYDQAAAIQQWLRTSFAYTLELPQSRREARLDHFLFQRRAGHCEYFSTAMAVLLRAGGVPARNVNGFLGGDWNELGQFLTITQNHAHSWVEVFFPGYGWVEFDPTPSAESPVRSGWLSSTRQYAGALEHRWRTWILDYDGTRQRSLLQRIARPETRAVDGEARRAWWPAPLLALLLTVLTLALLRLFRLRRSGSDDVRVYLAMRRAYERCGLPPADALPPLAFARAVAGLQGGADAERAVRLYLRTRFGGAPLTPAERTAMRASARAARRALRRNLRYASASGSVEEGKAGR